MAYTFYNTGAPDDAYWFDTKKKGSSPICDCEIFCSEKANCKYFVVGTTNCYLYSAAPSAGWQTNGQWNTYQVGNAGNSDCYNGVFNIEI